MVDPKTTIVSPSTDLRPDIVWWEDNPKKLQLVELMVPFETGFKDAAEELVCRAKQAGYNSHLITIEDTITRGPTWQASAD